MDELKRVLVKKKGVVLSNYFRQFSAWRHKERYNESLLRVHRDYSGSTITAVPVAEITTIPI